MTSNETLTNAGFKPGTPVYYFDATCTQDDLKAALFQTNRNNIVPLSNRLDEESSCSIMVTLVRPIFPPEVVALDGDPDSEDIWPDWYVEGKNLWHRQFGDMVRIYFRVIRGKVQGGYIQTIQDEAAPDGSNLVIIG